MLVNILERHPALHGKNRRWLITGVAGFIGSNLAEALLLAGQQVRGLDNFSTGHRRNLDEIRAKVGPALWQNFSFIEADIRNRDACAEAVIDIDHILHQAALGSVPRSIVDPLTTHDVNVTGFLNMLDAARRAGVPSFVYAASSSTYGDEQSLPKVESRIGNSLSPYAVTKYADELYASVFQRCYATSAVGLRYFNVFGPRQDPNGAYAAVIPRWASAMIRHDDVTINGDGTTSRDFCFIANVVQANILAALATGEPASQVYNVAVGDRTSLADLFGLLRDVLAEHQIHYDKEPVFQDFRAGDVRHSLASIEKASDLLGYAPTHTIDQGMREAMPWYIEFFKSAGRS